MSGEASQANAVVPQEVPQSDRVEAWWSTDPHCFQASQESDEVPQGVPLGDDPSPPAAQATPEFEEGHPRMIPDGFVQGGCRDGSDVDDHWLTTSMMCAFCNTVQPRGHAARWDSY